MGASEVRDPLGAPLTIEEALANSVEWRALTHSQIEVAVHAARLMAFEKGDILAPEGGPCEGIHIVRSGLVGVRKGTQAQHPVLFRLFRPGETLGLQPLLSEGRQLSDMTAMLPTTAWFLDRNITLMMIRSNPDVSVSIMKRLAQYITFVVEQTYAREVIDLRTRVHQLLMELDDDFGVTGPDGERLTELPISRNDIADMLGARRETVSRIISELNDEGIIDLHGRHLHIER